MTPAPAPTKESILEQCKKEIQPFDYWEEIVCKKAIDLALQESSNEKYCPSHTDEKEFCGKCMKEMLEDNLSAKDSQIATLRNQLKDCKFIMETSNSNALIIMKQQEENLKLESKLSKIREIVEMYPVRKKNQSLEKIQKIREALGE